LIMLKFFVCFLLLGSFFVSSKVFSANTDIVINEIGAYPTSTHEWIEIWNKSSEPVDLTGWKFWENNTNHGLAVSGTDAVVAAGEYAVIAQDANQFILDYPFFSGSIFDSSWTSLNESGEEIGLKDANGNFVEQFTYISAPNFSLQRKNPFLADFTNSNWAEHTSGNTVGALNIFVSPSSEQTTTSIPVSPAQSTGGNGSGPQTVQESPVQNLTSVKINEFVVDPQVDNEWVELYNTGSENLNLAGAMICDSRNSTSTCKKISGSIGPNKWFFVDLLTRSFLNNGGDSVIFKDAVGNIVDRVDYADELIPDEGQSLARKSDGIDAGNDDDWIVTDNLTPGAANIILDDSPVSNSSTPVKKIIGSKEKFVGLKWKIKYNLRLRQFEEGVFDASKTIDPRGGRVEYSWDLGDKIISDANIKYAFATSGKHIVIVHATSTAGTVDEKKIIIMVYPATETAGSGIIFSEILPSAGDDEDEFIKLKNISAQSVNMSNWKLAYKNDVYVIPSSTALAANDYLTFYKTITGFTLNNTGGELLLLDSDNILMDEVEYGKSEAGGVYVFNNEKWEWKMPTTFVKTVASKISIATKKLTGQFFTNIADARAGQKGDWARLKGIVAVLPGVFGSQYFYLTDGSAGIQIYQSKKDFPPLAVGDSAQIYGTVSEANGIKRINIKSKDDVDILSIDNAVTSTELNVDEIDESLAGGLVQIQGEITEIKSSFMYVDNGSGEAVVYFKQGAKIDKSKFLEGENVRVTGILEQTKTGWQIWPRSNNDIESLGPSEDLLKKQALSAGSDTKEKYLTATAGGVTTLLLAFFAKARGAFLKRGALALIGFIKKNKA